MHPGTESDSNWCAKIDAIVNIYSWADETRNYGKWCYISGTCEQSDIKTYSTPQKPIQKFQLQFKNL